MYPHRAFVIGLFAETEKALPFPKCSCLTADRFLHAIQNNCQAGFCWPRWLPCADSIAFSLFCNSNRNLSHNKLEEIDSVAFEELQGLREVWVFFCSVCCTFRGDLWCFSWRIETKYPLPGRQPLLVQLHQQISLFYVSVSVLYTAFFFTLIFTVSIRQW